MKKVFLSAILILAGNSAAFAQTPPQNPSQWKHVQVRRSKARQKGNLELDLSRWRLKLNQYHQGQRDDWDGYAILWNMLTDYGLLHSTGTAEAVQLSREYQVLFKKHPEYIQRRFLRTHGQEARRKAARGALKKKGQDLEEKRKNWTPLDNKGVKSDRNKNDLAVVYQYRIEFFHLKPSEIEPSGIVRISKISEKPHKIMTFQDNVINAAPMSCADCTGPAIAVCTDPEQGYFARTKAEQTIVGRDPIPWHNPKGEFRDFCGVINVDGTIAAQIPGEWNPTTYTEPLGILSDGKEALFGVGHMGLVRIPPSKYSEGGYEVPAFICQYFIHWTYPNKIEKIDIQKLTRDEFHAIEDKFRTAVMRPDDAVK